MPKIKTQFVCQQCGRISARDMGRCPQCDAWNSMIEEVVAPSKAKGKIRAHGLGGESTPRRLSEIGDGVEQRMALPIQEFARVLGGGVVPGSIVLVGGDVALDDRANEVARW